jgi:hypothetical protein
MHARRDAYTRELRSELISVEDKGNGSERERTHRSGSDRDRDRQRERERERERGREGKTEKENPSASGQTRGEKRRRVAVPRSTERNIRKRVGGGEGGGKRSGEIRWVIPV